MKLSICMIVKNEQAFLDSCLMSLALYADEIIVADTGSYDNTIETAKKYTPYVFEYQWNDDFAAARNTVMAKATGDWILVIDADEIISLQDHNKIRDMLKNSMADGYRFAKRKYFRDAVGLSGWTPCIGEYPEEKGYPGYIPEWQVRLFRNDPVIRFEGHVHECVEYSMRRNDKKIVLSDVPIHHFSQMKTDVQLAQKRQLYAKLGEKKIRFNPMSAKAHYELGVQLLELGEIKQATAVFLQTLKIDYNHYESWEMLGLAYKMSGEPDKALSALNKAIEIKPDNPYTWNNIASIYILCGEDAKARQALEKSLAINPLLPDSLYNMASLDYRQGNLEQAAAHVRSVLLLNERHFHGWVLEGQIAVAQNDLNKALSCFENALGINPECYEAYYYRANVNLLLGKPADAVVDLQVAWNGLHHYKVGLDLAHVLLGQGEVDRAQTVLASVTAAYPSYLPASHLLAQVRMLSGNR
ncbi:MAG: tetratricopeptide repeat protein [Candidatus Auribacterota bacterium]|nr:tetratricopeptide repeat protein [Candidatus Auribacterota bacterium]